MVGWVESVLLACASALLARLAGWLTTGAALAATVVGTSVLLGAGWSGAGALLTFFVTSTALTLRARRLMGDSGTRPRRWVQVLANGGVAGVAGIALVMGYERAWPAMLASLAAANADTWATELGRLFGRSPRIVTTLRVAAAGTSGAVTLTGFLAAAAGAGLVAAWGPSPLASATIGWFGALLDSVLGATVQGRFRCTECGAIVETSPHRTVSAAWIGGLPFVSNDVVNMLATLLAGLAGYVLVAP